MSDAIGEPGECLPAVRRPEEAAIRRAFDHVVIGSGTAGTKGRLHLDQGDGTPACSSFVTRQIKGKEWLTKSWAVYPPGYRDVCRYCATLYRRGEVTPADD